MKKAGKSAGAKVGIADGFWRGGGTPSTIRAAIYARVSTHDQQTLPMQLRTMSEYCVARGWDIALEVSEVASGTKVRPRRDEILAAARRRQIDVVIVWRLDRWGRSVPDLVVSLQELQGLSVAFVSLTEALDLTTPTGRAMAGLLAVFAAFEREVLCERVRAGLQEARERGTVLGRPASALAKAEQVMNLRARGLSKVGIARMLGIGQASVARILSHCSVEIGKTATVLLTLRIENNSKFVRGKKRVKEGVERYLLDQYAYQPRPSGEYELRVPHQTEEDLDKTMEDLLRQIAFEADLRNCFSESEAHLEGSDRWW